MSDCDFPFLNLTRVRLVQILAAWVGVLSLCFSDSNAATLPAGSQRVGTRTALIIGNSGYATGTLTNPVNDARLMATTLRELGYEVTMLENASLQRMIDSSRYWISQTTDADVRLFFFAGHGVQSKGRNYLIPVDAQIRTEQELPSLTFDVSAVIDRLSRADRGVNVVILDACRNAPFPETVRQLPGRAVNANVNKGLKVENAPKGTLVAFSTSPGMVASDGRGLRNSVYTRTLAEQMSVAGVPVESVFKRVRNVVMEETANGQVPWESSSLIGDFCFRTTVQGECGDVVRPSSGASIDLMNLQRKD